MFTQAKIIARSPQAETGVAVVTVPDLRWKRRDIKSVALLPQVLAKQAAAEAGVTEAWMVEDGFVTEAARPRPSSSRGPAYLDAASCRTRSCPASPASRSCGSPPTGPYGGRASLYGGRGSCGRRGLPDERLDAGHAGGRGRRPPVGTGRPGPLSRRLRELYLQMAGASRRGCVTPVPYGEPWNLGRGGSPMEDRDETCCANDRRRGPWAACWRRAPWHNQPRDPNMPTRKAFRPRRWRPTGRPGPPAGR